MAIPNLMHRCVPDPDSAIEQDRKDIGVVLSVLLDEHPIRMTLDELILVMHADPEDDDPGATTKDAIRELVSAGLVHRDGRFLAPTRAALYFFAVDAD
jgi:hypothetical protein